MMVVLDEIDQRTRHRRPRWKLQLPETRPSILDPRLESEPSLGQCPSSETLVLFLDNHPVALIPGTSLEYTSLNTRLFQLRHRWPRAANSGAKIIAPWRKVV